MKFIVTLILVFFLLRLILKPLLRLVISSVLGKMAQQGGSFQRSYTYPNKKQKPEGTIDVEPKVKNNDGRAKAADSGEYIDYEEIK